MFGRENPRRQSAALVLVSSVLLAGAAVAQPAESAAGGQSQAQAQVDEKKVCKRVIPTGSRIARRYCLTRSQWETMREEGQKAARDAFALESQYGYDASPSGS